jgi:hypothetical protein
VFFKREARSTQYLSVTQGLKNLALAKRESHMQKGVKPQRQMYQQLAGLTGPGAL